MYMYTAVFLKEMKCMYMETLSRSLLLVVALGYGIVRPKLMTTEWIAILVVSLLYFITGTNTLT
jgi:hypothetical protein